MRRIIKIKYIIFVSLMIMLSSNYIVVAQQNNEKIDYVLSGLKQFEKIDPDKVKIFIVIIAIYIITVGPLNYLFLDKINKLDWLFYSAPIISVLFCIILFIVANVTGLYGVRANTAAFMYADKNGEATVIKYKKITGINGGKAKIEDTEGNELTVIPLEYYYSSPNEKDNELVKVKGKAINIGKVASDIRSVNGILTGRMTNLTNFNFQDCYIINKSKNTYYKIGTMKISETKGIETHIFHKDRAVEKVGDINLTNSYEIQGISQEAFLVNSALEDSVNEMQGDFLIALARTPVDSSLKVNGKNVKEQEIGIILMPLEITLMDKK